MAQKSHSVKRDYSAINPDGDALSCCLLVQLFANDGGKTGVP